MNNFNRAKNPPKAVRFIVRRPRRRDAKTPPAQQCEQYYRDGVQRLLKAIEETEAD